MIASRFIVSCLSAISFASIALGQAAVEYAAKSSAVSDAGNGAHLGACPLDSMLVPCFKQSYPAAFYTAIVVICLALGVLVYPKSRV